MLWGHVTKQWNVVEQCLSFHLNTVGSMQCILHSKKHASIPFLTQSQDSNSFYFFHICMAEIQSSILVCYSDFHNSVWLSYHSKALEEHKVVEEEDARGQQCPPHVSERLWLIHTWQTKHMTQSLRCMWSFF